MLSPELDSILYAISKTKDINEPKFRESLVASLRSARDTARVLEEKIIIQTSQESENVQVFNTTSANAAA
ncbi:MAG: hypothetical protein ACK5N8_02135 [Alphaproteobacteria bacterium]